MKKLIAARARRAGLVSAVLAAVMLAAAAARVTSADTATNSLFFISLFAGVGSAYALLRAIHLGRRSANG